MIPILSLISILSSSSLKMMSPSIFNKIYNHSLILIKPLNKIVFHKSNILIKIKIIPNKVKKSFDLYNNIKLFKFFKNTFIY